MVYPNPRGKWGPTMAWLFRVVQHCSGEEKTGIPLLQLIMVYVDTVVFFTISCKDIIWQVVQNVGYIICTSTIAGSLYILVYLKDRKACILFPYTRQNHYGFQQSFTSKLFRFQFIDTLGQAQSGSNQQFNGLKTKSLSQRSTSQFS